VICVMTDMIPCRQGAERRVVQFHVQRQPTVRSERKPQIANVWPAKNKEKLNYHAAPRAHDLRISYPPSVNGATQRQHSRPRAKKLTLQLPGDRVGTELLKTPSVSDGDFLSNGRSFARFVRSYAWVRSLLTKPRGFLDLGDLNLVLERGA